MNILVTGANGQLGNALRKVASKSGDNYIYTDVDDLDITDKDAVLKMVINNNIKIIVNCAAYTNVDKAEMDVESAYKLNAEAVYNLANAIKVNDGILIHISTDYIFGNSAGNTPHIESEPGNPLGVYGKTKLKGEQFITASGCKHIIFRTSWLYSENGKNFVKTMLNLTATKSELHVVFDQIGTPTYAADLANAIFDIIENRMYSDNEGIYHYSNEGVCSWFDFAKMISEFADNRNCNIKPCHSDEYPSHVVRPSYSVLDKTKYKKTFNKSIPYWTDSLKTCIRNLKQDEA